MDSDLYCGECQNSSGWVLFDRDDKSCSLGLIFLIPLCILGHFKYTERAGLAAAWFYDTYGVAWVGAWHSN